MDKEKHNELQNPFKFNDGDYVKYVDDWTRRRKEIYDMVIEIQYGGMPPTPTSTESELLHFQKKPEGGKMSRRILTGPGRNFHFPMVLYIPPGEGPFPVVVSGDACWRYITDNVIDEVLRRGIVLAVFNRVEIAPDIYNSDRNSGIYRIYPQGEYGALSAWAWGYHRCIDALVEMDFIDASSIAVIGHSRGGKAALLAGATDERIALTAANNSGSGGAGSYLLQGPGSETLEDTDRAIPYWFGPEMSEYVGRESELPFDQHFLKSLVAPRSLLTMEALGDLWANPTGTWQTHEAAREVYKFLGAEDRIGISYREGGHRLGWDDWCTFLDFMEWQLCGRTCDKDFNANPFNDLPEAFSWEV